MYQGFLRLLLSLIVLFFHFFSTGPMPGRIAVFAFYLVSGYLITRVLNERYTGVGGLARFGINRYLRLYPTYLVALALAVIVLSLAKPQNPPRLDGFALPDTAAAWLRQFTIVGLTQFDSGLYPVRLVSTAFSLAVELAHYAWMALVIRTSKLAVAVWWITGFVIAVVLIHQDDFQNAFLSYWGPTLMFASGAALYHLDPWLRRTVAPHLASAPATLGLFAAIVLYCYLPLILAGTEVALGMGSVEMVKKQFAHPSVLMLFGTAPLAAAALYAALSIKSDRSGSVWTSAAAARVSDFCGDLSYPLFLVHITVYFVVTSLFPALGLVPTVGLTLLASLLISAGLVRYLEHPIEGIRRRFRVPSAATARSAPEQEPVRQFA